MYYEEALRCIKDRWEEMTDTGKIQALQAVENKMAFESGRLPCPVVGRFLYTGDAGIVLGSYSREERMILINTSQFDPDAKYGKEELVKACLHEGRHAFQHQVCEGLAVHKDPEEVKIWRDNLKNYVSFDENPRGYVQQPVEADARTFADRRYARLLAETEFAAEGRAVSAKDVFVSQYHVAQTGQKDVAWRIGEARQERGMGVSW